MDLDILESRSSSRHIKNRKILQDNESKNYVHPFEGRLRNLQRDSPIREPSPLFSGRINIVEQQCPVISSTNAPTLDCSKSRKLQELIERQSKKYELPVLKPSLKIIPEGRNEMYVETERSTSCSLIIRKTVNLKDFDSVNKSKLLNSIFIYNISNHRYHESQKKYPRDN